MKIVRFSDIRGSIEKSGEERGRIELRAYRIKTMDIVRRYTDTEHNTSTHAHISYMQNADI